jgi:hypothetical protein
MTAIDIATTITLAIAAIGSDNHGVLPPEILGLLLDQVSDEVVHGCQ